jgi:hypothetical protein
MSFDLGKDTSFNPPPPPKRRMSPWAITGIGCLVLLVGGAVGIGVLVSKATNAMKEEMKKPVNKEQALADLEDTPIYSKAQFDEMGTRMGRAGMSLGRQFIPAEKTAIVGFRTEDPASTVYAWYDEKMATLGFRPEEGGRGAQRGGHAFRKGNDMVMVQMNKAKGEWNSLILMRFYNVKKK